MKNYPPLDDLSNLLRHLHKALLEAEAENFGPIKDPFQLLNLAMHHKHFAWLRRLSELMVELDEIIESDEAADPAQAAAFRAAVEGLIGPRPPSQPQFRERYLTLLQQSPTAAMAHGDLRRLLEKFPKSPLDEADTEDNSG